MPHMHTMGHSVSTWTGSTATVSAFLLSLSNIQITLETYFEYIFLWAYRALLNEQLISIFSKQTRSRTHWTCVRVVVSHIVKHSWDYYE